MRRSRRCDCIRSATFNDCRGTLLLIVRVMADSESVPLLSRAKRLVCACLPCGRATIGRHRVRIGKLFAEGGFSSVYRCMDLNNGESYALKKMIASEEEQVSWSACRSACNSACAGLVKCWSTMHNLKSPKSMQGY